MSDDETSDAGRFANLAVAAAVAAGSAFGGNVANSQFSETFQDSIYEGHPALELSADLGEAVGAYTDTRERAEQIEDAIENPQEGPLYASDRDITDVMADQADQADQSLADALADAAVAIDPGTDGANGVTDYAEAELAADLADIATEADLGETGDLGGDTAGGDLGPDVDGDLGGDAGGGF